MAVATCLPNEIYPFIFDNFAVREFVKCSTVCKKWYVLSHDPAILNRYLKVLQEVFLIPPKWNTDHCQGWILMKECYSTECEIFVDVSASMCISNGPNAQQQLSPHLMENVEAIINKLLPHVKKITLSAFSTGPYKCMIISPKKTLTDLREKLQKYRNSGTSLTFLEKKLRTYIRENKNTLFSEKNRQIIVISDLIYNSINYKDLLRQIESAHYNALFHNNISLIFHEVRVKSWPNADKSGFKPELKKTIEKSAMKFVHIIEDTAPIKSEPIKRKRED